MRSIHNRTLFSHSWWLHGHRHTLSYFRSPLMILAPSFIASGNFRSLFICRSVSRYRWHNLIEQREHKKRWRHWKIEAKIETAFNEINFICTIPRDTFHLLPSMSKFTILTTENRTRIRLYIFNMYEYVHAGKRKILATGATVTPYAIATNSQVHFWYSS